MRNRFTNIVLSLDLSQWSSGSHSHEEKSNSG